MKRFFQNSLFAVIYTTLGIPLGYLVRLLLSQSLTIEQYGLFFAILGFFGFIGSFNDLGFSEAQAYFIPKYLERKEPHKIKTAIKVQLINQFLTTGLISLIVLLNAEYISNKLFHVQSATPILIIMIIYFIVSDLQRNTQTLFYAFQDIKTYGSSEMVRLIITSGLMFFIFIFFKNNLQVVALAWSLIFTFIALLYFLIFFYRHPEIIKAKSYSIIAIYKEFFPIAFPVLLMSGASVIFSSTASLLLTYIKGVKEVAMFNIAEPISNILLIFVTPIASLLMPLSAQLDEQKNYLIIKRILAIVFNFGVFFLLPLVLTLVFYSKESVIFLFGNKFPDASPTLKIFAINLFFVIINKFLYNIISGLGLQKKRLKIVYFSAIINLILAVILIPHYGSVGAISAITITQIILTIGGILVIKNKIDFIIPWANYLKIIILLFGYLLLQYYLKPISSNLIIIQFLLFGLKIFLGLLLYYLIGIFILRIVDTILIKQLVFNYMPVLKKYYKKTT